MQSMDSFRNDGYTSCWSIPDYTSACRVVEFIVSSVHMLVSLQTFIVKDLGERI